MRASLLVSLVRIVAAAGLFVPSARATGTLTYGGPGYDVELEVGETSVPVIASVKVTPRHGAAVVMPPGACTTAVFNPDAERLLLRCRGLGNQIRPFSLSVSHRGATLTIGGVVHRWQHFQWVL